MMLRRLAILSPALFSLAPILLLAAANLEQVNETWVIATLCAISLVAAAVLTGLVWCVVRNLERASLIASLLVGCFFVYGHAFELLESLEVLAKPWQIHLLLGLAIVVLVFVCSRMILRAGEVLPRITTSFVAVSGILTILAAIQLLIGIADEDSATRRTVTSLSASRPSDTPPPLDEENRELPDIYYIILDGYARKDVLAERYQFDNTEFLSALQARGFYVADKSCSNYPMTFLSLASSLNMRHILQDTEAIGRTRRKRRPIYDLIHDNEVARSLQQRGYRYLHINTNWTGTERSAIADQEFSAFGPLMQKEFTALLIRTTALRGLTPGVADIHRYSLDKLKEIPQLKGPTFTFCHLIIPHNPYVFDRHGNRTADVPLWLQFDENGKTGGWHNKEGYLEQLQFVNHEILTIVSKIIESSAIPPVIILQADHGSATSANRTPPAQNVALIKERMPILNAYYVPESCRKKLYPHISPVNTFRILFNGLFGMNYDLLDDRQYISWYRRPYDLIDCTKTFQHER
jgi:hypothetical protein